MTLDALIAALMASIDARVQAGDRRLVKLWSR